VDDPKEKSLPLLVEHMKSLMGTAQFTLLQQYNGHFCPFLKICSFMERMIEEQGYAANITLKKRWEEFSAQAHAMAREVRET